MALETTTTPPMLDSFTLLSDHREQTPGTFFGGKPVLHLQSPGAKIKVSRNDLEQVHELKNLVAESVGDNTRTENDQATIVGIDVWVSSR